MAGQFLSPGVKITLQDFSVYTSQVSNCIVGMVGGFTKGPFDVPTLVTSPSDFIRKFGQPSALDHAGLAAMMYLQRGNQLYVVRVEDGTSTPAMVAFNCKAGDITIPDALKLTLKEKGTFGNDYNAQATNVNGKDFTLMIYQGSKLTDQFPVSLDPDSQYYILNRPFDLFTVEFDEEAGTGGAKASANFGTGINGTINITANEVGLAGNNMKLEVIKPSAVGADLEATFINDKLTVSLATDGSQSKDAEARFGIGDDGTVLLRSITAVKEEGNDLSVEVLKPSTPGEDPKAQFSDTDKTQLQVYLGTETPAETAFATVGSDPNGTISLEILTPGVDGNDYSIELVEGSGNDVLMTAVESNKHITVTLGTDGSGALDPTKNTATLIVASLNLISEIDASTSGDGSYVYGVAVPSVQFTGGADEITADSKNTAQLLAGICNGLSGKKYVCTFSGDGSAPVQNAQAITPFSGGTSGHYAAAENTALKITAKINAIINKPFLAAYSGDGNGEVTDAVVETNFTGGADGSGITEIVATATPIPFTGGTDGLPITKDKVVSGLDLFSNPDNVDINVLICPGRWEAPIVNKMLAICKTRGDSICIIDPPQGLSVSDVIKYRNGTLFGPDMPLAPFDTFFAAMYYPWVQVINPSSGEYEWAPPSGVVTGAYAYSDQTSELWMAPAGLTRGVLPDVVATERELTQDDMDNLYSGGTSINPILNYKRQGFVLWGQRTLQKASTAMDRVNVTRLVLFLMKTIAISTAYLVFEQNDDTTWNQWKGMIRPILERTKKARGIDEYIIVMDRTTVTTENIERGEMPGYVAIRPVKAAEFIPIDFILMAQGATFTVS